MRRGAARSPRPPGVSFLRPSLLPTLRAAAAGIAPLRSCTRDQPLEPDRPPPPREVDVLGSLSDATLMVRTPSAPYGERGGTTIDLEAVVVNKRGHPLPNKQHTLWRSLDESRATVDSLTGLATAQDTGLVDVVVDHK